MLVEVAYAGGLRVSEIVGLDWADVMPRDEGRVQLSITGKGGAGQLSNGLRTRSARRESFSKGPTAVIRKQCNGHPAPPGPSCALVKLGRRHGPHTKGGALTLSPLPGNAEITELLHKQCVARTLHGLF